MFNGERISLHGLKEVLIANDLKAPGDIQLVGSQLLARTSDSVVEITEVTPSGKKRMTGADFARGARLDSGSKFE
jgi:methionyl-tRNA formyltransferase